jgi:hypothetical protein
VRSIRISVSLGIVISASFAMDCEDFITSCITKWLYNHFVKLRSCREIEVENESYTKNATRYREPLRL